MKNVCPEETPEPPHVSTPDDEHVAYPVLEQVRVLVPEQVGADESFSTENQTGMPQSV